MPPPPTPLAFVFDDGFRRSSIRTAAIFARFGLRATFAVLADPVGFAPGIELGDFALWNELARRGHVVHPHGCRHLRLWEVDHTTAAAEVERCLALFAEKLDGFEASRAVYHHAYNRGTRKVDRLLLLRGCAVRGAGDGRLSAAALAVGRWHSTTFGPGDPTDHVRAVLDACRRRPPAAVIVSLHGLDGEGWGAMPAASLERLLDEVTSSSDFTYWRLDAPPATSPSSVGQPDRLPWLGRLAKVFSRGGSDGTR